MERKAILSSSLILLILGFSFLTLTYSQKSSDFSPTISTAPLFVGVIFRDDLASLNQSTRMEIYNFVTNNPGIQFRGICNGLNLPIGTVQHHLDLLTKAGLLSFFRDGRYKRYFESKRFTETEMTVISFLRHQTAGKILSILLEKVRISHRDLTQQLEISSQALTWQMKRLKDSGLVHGLREGMKVNYFLDEACAVAVRQWVHLADKSS